jgi:hypothetical protein
MHFRQTFLDGIRMGPITLALRRWRHPSVRAGGTLLTPVGQLEIGAVSGILESEISGEDARRAGYASREDLIAELDERSGGDPYRIELVALWPDPLIEPRDRMPDREDIVTTLGRLNRLDAASHGP